MMGGWMERRRRRIAEAERRAAESEQKLDEHRELSRLLNSQAAAVTELSEFADRQLRTNHLTQLFADIHHPRPRRS